MSSATSEQSRHMSAIALRGAGLLDKNKNKDNDARMVDVAARGVKRTRKVRSGTHMDVGRESSSRSSLVAGKQHGSSSSLAIRGSAAKLNLIGTSSKISRRTSEHVRRTVPTAPTPARLELWKEFITKRWRPEAQFLDLEHVAGDPIVKRIRRTSKEFPDPKEASVMFKMAGQLKPDVLALSLAHNGLTNTSSLETIAKYLPNLRNLSLADNKLPFWRDLDIFTMKRNKLLQLKELVLTGNPMRDLDPSPSKMERYRTEILRRFPTLDLLDSQAVARITFNEPGTSTLPPPTPGQGPSSFPVEMNAGLIAPGIESYVSEFLYRFFTAYDSSRASLAEVYAPDATFSFSANTGIPPRARIQGHHNSLPNQKSLAWSPYIQHGSRNLSRVHIARAQEYLFIGPENIVKKITAMPGTRHDIAVLEKFVADAWPVSGVLGPSEVNTVLFVSVYGQFEEEPSHGIRSFDRHFILGPVQPGSNAQAAGWQVVILSDQLVIRAYSSHEAWIPGPILMPPVESTSTPPPRTQSLAQPQPVAVVPAMVLSQHQQQQLMGDPALAQLPEPQRSYVVELSMRTRLTVAFSIECLEMNGWDPQKALANFEELRTQLPQEVFF